MLQRRRGTRPRSLLSASRSIRAIHTRSLVRRCSSVEVVLDAETWLQIGRFGRQASSTRRCATRLSPPSSSTRRMGRARSLWATGTRRPTAQSKDLEHGLWLAAISLWYATRSTLPVVAAVLTCVLAHIVTKCKQHATRHAINVQYNVCARNMNKI